MIIVPNFMIFDWDLSNGLYTINRGLNQYRRKICLIDKVCYQNGNDNR